MGAGLGGEGRKKQNCRLMKKLLLLLGFLFATNAIADNNGTCSYSQNCYNSGVYIYEGGQDLIDLYSMSGTTNLNSGDDSWSSEVSLGMEWDRWGQTWSHAKMSTNGCATLEVAWRVVIQLTVQTTDLNPCLTETILYTLYGLI